MEENHPLELTKIKIEEKEFLKLNYLILYTGSGILLLGAGLFMLSVFATNQEFIPFLGIGLFFTIGWPVLIYIKSKNTYATNKWINQPITYIFSKKEVRIEGPSFYMTTDWNSFVFIKETKEWYMFFYGKNNGIFIPKDCLAPAEESKLRALIMERQGYTKIKLK